MSVTIYSLCPLSWNFLPRAVSAPPPAGFAWHAAHASLVCAAYCGVAVAVRSEKAVVSNSAKAAAARSASESLRETLRTSMVAPRLACEYPREYDATIGRASAPAALRFGAGPVGHRDRIDAPESKSASGNVADVIELAASVQSDANDPKRT